MSLASLLRSYTAAHGLNGNRQTTVELGEERILVRHGDDGWICSARALRSPGGAKMEEMESWSSPSTDDCAAAAGEEEMDMAAERWARELMQEPQQ